MRAVEAVLLFIMQLMNAQVSGGDLCAAAVASLVSGFPAVVAVGDGSLFTRLIADGASWQPCPPISLPLKGGPVTVGLPDGSMLIAVCDSNGTSMSTTATVARDQSLHIGDWSSLGGPACELAPITLVEDAARLHVFITAQDGVWHGHRLSLLTSSMPFSWNFLGSGQCVAASIDSGFIHAVLRDANGTLSSLVYARDHRETRSSWSASGAVGVGLSRGTPHFPHALRRSSLLELYMRAHDSTFRRAFEVPRSATPRSRMWQTETLGGALASSPSATEDDLGVMHVFGLGPDGTIWHNARRAQPERARVYELVESAFFGSAPPLTTAWMGWGSLGGDAFTAPLSTRRQDGLISVIVGGSDGFLYVKTQERNGNSTNWGAWHALGGPVKAFAC